MLSKFTANFIHTSVTILILAFGGHLFATPAQDDLRNTVYGTAKKPAAEKSKTSKRKTKSSVARTANKNGSNSKKRTSKTFLEVTFLAKEPSVEVFLNNKTIGVTDENFRLSRKLAPGEYLLLAKNKRLELVAAKKINISAGETSFNLFDENAEQPTPEIEKPAAKLEKSDAEIALEKGEKVKKILEDYINPATTDSVKTEDWEFVFQVAQTGQLPGYTAVQLEAQRWLASGEIELAKGDVTNALTAFNKAQEFMPASALPAYGLGNTYFLSRKYLEALRFYQKALQIDPKLAKAYRQLGDTQRLLGKEKEAIIAYKSAIQFGYATPETRFWLGTLMLETKQIEEAIRELETVAREMPKAEVFIGIGNGYEKLKRDVSAIEAYQKAIDSDPNSSLAYYKLADVFLNQREYTKAKEAYEKALALDPDGKIINRPEAQKKLREVSTKGIR